jgi:hypothetical protein
MGKFRSIMGAGILKVDNPHMVLLLLQRKSEKNFFCQKNINLTNLSVLFDNKMDLYLI